ncbi:MAG: holo-ACP synthase [Acidimicrobiales bacterium]
MIAGPLLEDSPAPRVGVGVDVVDLERFRRVVERRPQVVARLFTDGERAYAGRASEPTKRLAVRFAAKEAAMKVLGAGIGAVAFKEVEVLRDPDGAPRLVLSGSAADRAERLGFRLWHVSLSHSDLVAVASVIGERGSSEPGSAGKPLA